MKKRSLIASLLLAVLIGPTMTWLTFYMLVTSVILIDRTGGFSFSMDVIKDIDIMLVPYVVSVIIAFCAMMLVGLPFHFWAAKRGFVSMRAYLLAGAGLALPTMLLVSAMFLASTYGAKGLSYLLDTRMLFWLLLASAVGVAVAGVFWLFQVRSRPTSSAPTTRN